MIPSHNYNQTEGWIFLFVLFKLPIYMFTIFTFTNTGNHVSVGKIYFKGKLYRRSVFNVILQRVVFNEKTKI